MSLRTAMNTYYDVDDPGAAPGSSPTAPTLAEQYQASQTEDEETEIPSYELGGDNIVYWANVEFDPSGVLSNLQAAIYGGLSVRGAELGWTQATISQMMEGIWGTGQFGGFLDGIWQSANTQMKGWQSASRYVPEEIRIQQEQDLKNTMGAHYYTQTQAGFMELTTRVWNYFNQRTAVDLGAYPTAGRRGGRGGGGGRGGPTAEEIRGQFDLDELAEAASNIWRGMLLTDDADTRGMAKAYVDAIVAGKGKKKIDFTEYIRGKAKKTDRYASIYRNKPESMSEEQYLAPYFQSAMQVVRPEQADEIAIQGAQFGASSSAFAARLQRENVSAAPFMQDLQRRLTDLNEVFRG